MGKGQDPRSQINRQTHHNNHLFICDFCLEVDKETQKVDPEKHIGVSE
jgi:hypothetical protein